ncbi:MAG: hypothetical protein ABIH65_03965 [Nanoarchaeota archaeon]
MALENIIKKSISNPLGIVLGSFLNYVSTNGFCIYYDLNDYSTDGLIVLGIVDICAATLLYTSLKEILKSNSNLN